MSQQQQSHPLRQLTCHQQGSEEISALSAHFSWLLDTQQTAARAHVNTHAVNDECCHHGNAEFSIVNTDDT